MATPATAPAPRKHRILTAPSGVVAFACVILPAYRDCGHNVAMAENPGLAIICLLGLGVAVCSLAAARRSHELAVAITCLVIAAVAAGLTSLAAVASERPFVGLTLASAAWVGTTAGAVCWVLEIGRVRAARRAILVLAIVLPVAYGAVIARSTWHPPPEEQFDLGSLLVH